MDYELGVPGTVGGGVNDLTMVNGQLTLGGTLNLTALPGFGPGTYELFSYTGSLTANTVTFGTLPPGYGAGNFSISTATAGQVDLVVGVNGGLLLQYWDGATTTGDGTVHGGAGTGTAR